MQKCECGRGEREWFAWLHVLSKCCMYRAVCSWLSVLIKPTCNAPFLTYQVMLFNSYPDEFRRSSEPSSGSPVLPLEFSDTPKVYKILSNRILQKISFHAQATFIEINSICAIDSTSLHNVIQNIFSQKLITGGKILTLLRAWRHCPLKQVFKAQ
jgi:hypothetical protein